MSATERFCFHICGTSKVQPWPLTWPAKDRFADGSGAMPFIGDVVSEYFTGTTYEALVRRAQLARLHRSSDFIAKQL